MENFIFSLSVKSIDVQLSSIVCYKYLIRSLEMSLPCQWFLSRKYTTIIEKIHVQFSNIFRNEKLFSHSLISIGIENCNSRTLKAVSQFHIPDVEFHMLIFIFRVLIYNSFRTWNLYYKLFPYRRVVQHCTNFPIFSPHRQKFTII